MYTIYRMNDVNKLLRLNGTFVCRPLWPTISNRHCRHRMRYSLTTMPVGILMLHLSGIRFATGLRVAAADTGAM